ncbi:UNVERIFIED_CONTAM: hypothetical protein Slati_0894000 [Sesamum latifolium]|uniref:Reverse transcriptase domain-containing protein n=1 Tax=Sesamum latifolium TaxID=2727402 RepID=A0AAW2XN35_9LAMI
MIRPVEREEIKAAFFDIDEDKAPGPDGFSAGFFKAAWSVIGDELTTAIQDFFVSEPTTTCALKVDLWKAYDTLEWDFIHAMLSVFGFPKKMIMWIVECISTTTYSVALNGELHGFFPGARGIRQDSKMDSLKTLSSLTHTTPSTHTKPTHAHTALDDLEDGEEGDLDGGRSLETTTIDGPGDVARPLDESSISNRSLEARIQSEFNFPEFLLLANWVIDDGDASAMAALHELQLKWMAKFGTPMDSSWQPRLKPVSAQPPSPSAAASSSGP